MKKCVLLNSINPEIRNGAVKIQNTISDVTQRYARILGNTTYLDVDENGDGKYRVSAVTQETNNADLEMLAKFLEESAARIRSFKTETKRPTRHETQHINCPQDFQ